MGTAIHPSLLFGVVRCDITESGIKVFYKDQTMTNLLQRVKQ